MLRRRSSLTLSRQLSTSAHDAARRLLGVAADASPEDLKAAYRAKALAHHPDRHLGEERARAEQRFKEVGEAYVRLSGATRRRAEDLSPAEAEELFIEILRAGGDAGLAWRVPGRSRPRDAEAAPRWQQYQSALLESGGVANWGAETRALYRACLRALRGADEGTAAAVRQHARANIAQHAGETDGRTLRGLLVGGRHDLEELCRCLGSARVGEEARGEG